MDYVRLDCQAQTPFTLLCDEHSEIVQHLMHVIRRWDRKGTIQFVTRTSGDAAHFAEDLDRTPWGLMVIDEFNEKWYGPEALPIIFKNLPFGKLAAVLYILPGTMWLTQAFFQVACRRNQRVLTERRAHSV